MCYVEYFAQAVDAMRARVQELVAAHHKLYEDLRPMVCHGVEWKRSIGWETHEFPCTHAGRANIVACM